MKSLIITLFAALATASTAMAQQATKAYTMHVNTADGNSVEYKFAKEPVATFKDGKMLIETISDQPVTYVLDNVTNITFGADLSSINATTNGDGSRLSITTTGDEIIVGGMQPAARLTVYDAGGTLCASANADANGRAVINVGNIGKGVFVVNTPKNSFKFTK